MWETLKSRLLQTSKGKKPFRRQPTKGDDRQMACDQSQLLIMDEPTRGIDVGAKSEIHKMLRELANEGTGVIIISSRAAGNHRRCGQGGRDARGENQRGAFGQRPERRKYYRVRIGRTAENSRKLRGEKWKKEHFKNQKTQIHSKKLFAFRGNLGYFPDHWHHSNPEYPFRRIS